MNDIFHAVFSTQGFVLGTLVPFLFVLTVVVFVHEMGHYLIGRWCGIGVKAFSIGFGPELFGFNDRRGTRWKLCAIPLGGYVKFVGDMNATSSQPSAEEIESLTEAEREVAFHTQPIWKRAATVVAGPLFNFLLTIAVFAVLFSLYGRPVLEPTVAQVTAGSPAEKAGIQPGDRFVKVDGSKVETFADVQRLVSGRAGDAITFTMLRDGKEIEVTATPQPMEQQDALGNKVKVAVIGVVNNAELGQPRLVSYTPAGAVVAAVEETGHVIQRTGQFLQRFALGREDKCQLGGPIKIAKMSGQAAKLGFEWLVQLVAFLSVGIGFLNLLPIPPLDGGHLLFYGVEAVIRRPVSERMMEMAYRTGLFLVLGFMGFVFWNDLFGC
ncbi:RIP metalloprotease RseP [Mesorhizobium sp. M2D.F.Ca.ET.185.01.1.1]|uniref:RIP metalloprotease RseP n=1 Tax=unclassified Mesorhizobium TaxID=325217 RepID=UPI000FC9C781|nr:MULTISPECIES: RIP metalloprotease RseP [unclassified Mesorhizobium]TGP52789.1 RIP metalloprotease RseP [bacterium M00.F.Ca.ET.230.01.1.1]TGP80939.1 RIP metalloprotease RseP [bacterium M00.F.Ca.ET.227.01.1.1]TGP90722.1 RIP metalloprotease RseP [bacterium M00.F.Ca.ET.221.01.1.1]TGP97401.1 RIP metalloprotease RseP [bacterium M00.F.Ca.ET.222.01.1.1]TGT75933.1 RIP metalloprotease RseP [bacterium M00.F.Ca.ET.159.01.1.1]TGT84994.1 RIP metalloprotease RseP [bacterium M00.F.Ca.ET.157.01.1.1]TGU079